MLHNTSPCTVRHLYIVVLAYRGTTFLSTQFRTPLWLKSTTTSWDIWVSFTEELLPHMLQEEASESTPRGEVLRYSPIADTFPIYYCQLETITMICHYGNIFTGRNRYRDVKSILLPGHSCLQAELTHTVPIGRHSKTLTKVPDNDWKIPVSPIYNCTFSMTVVKAYHIFHAQTYKAQLVGAPNVIEQHLANTTCSAVNDTTLKMSSCSPQQNPKYIIVRSDPHHQCQEINTLRVHEIKQQGDYRGYTM